MAKKHKYDYFDAYEELSDLAVQEASVLVRAMENFTDAAALRAVLDEAHALEHAGDMINHDIYKHVGNVHFMHHDAEEFACLIKKSCVALDKAMVDFRNFKKSKNFKQLVIQVSDNEEEADALYVEVIRNLHVNHADEPMHVLKWSRLYAFMESCCDACEHTADLMSTILLKNM